MVLSTQLVGIATPDVKSLTSVADNFNAGCTGLVDGVCLANPATKVLGCISSETDICQHVSLLLRHS